MNFKSIDQLFDYFKDEATCRNYLEQKRWGGTAACHHCGSLKVWRTNRGFKCGEKLCGKKFTVTTGTMYENTKLSIRTWFAAIYLITTDKKGLSSLNAREKLGITQQTAWFLNHRIREMMKEQNIQPLTGTVEVDETYVGGKMKNKHKKHRMPETANNNKTAVVAYISREGLLRTKVMDNRSEIMQSVIENVHPEAQLITDESGLYYHANRHFILHEVVKHSQDEYVRGTFHTNTVEGFFGLFKRSIFGIYHQVSAKHLQRYCTENAFRYNNRKMTPQEKFDSVMIACDGRLKYKDLIKKTA